VVSSDRPHAIATGRLSVPADDHADLELSALHPSPVPIVSWSETARWGGKSLPFSRIERSIPEGSMFTGSSPAYNLRMVFSGNTPGCASVWGLSPSRIDRPELG